VDGGHGLASGGGRVLADVVGPAARQEAGHELDGQQHAEQRRDRAGRAAQQGTQAQAEHPGHRQVQRGAGQVLIACPFSRQPWLA